MGTNTLAGYGLQFASNRRVGSNTYQANQYTIKKAYGTSIGVGDVVQSGSGGNEGYVILAPDNAATVLGIFVNVLPWKAGTNGAPNASGISSLYLDGTTIAETATLPFRIMGVTGISGGPQDPANTNPTILVCMNTSENLNSQGV